MDAHLLEGGFNDAPRNASHAFRALMNAMARPGTIYDIEGGQPPAPLSVAAGTALLTLVDPDTPIYLAGAYDTPEVRGWISFHTGAPFAGPATAMFALGTWDALTPLSQYPVGTPEYPDRATTLIVEMPDLAAKGATLSGPGIKDEAALNLPDADALRSNAAQFPLGLDFFFTAASRVAALPRSTRIR